jgi:outer membrane autotransporter protein
MRNNNRRAVQDAASATFGVNATDPALGADAHAVALAHPRGRRGNAASRSTPSTHSGALIPRSPRLRAVCVMTTCLGAYAPSSWATCSTVGTTITCTGTTTGVPVGSGMSTVGSTVNIGDPSTSTPATVSSGDNNGVSVYNNNTIVLVAGSVLSNSAVNATGNFGKGGNTIEFNNGNTLTIGVGASIESNGTATNAEAINPIGINNTITNNGTISAAHAAGIWFDGAGPNTIINSSTGVISGVGQAINLGTGALTLTNAGSISGSVTGGIASVISNSGTITGALAGGANSQITNSGRLTGALTAGNTSTLTVTGTISGTAGIGTGSSVTVGAAGHIGGTLTEGGGSSLDQSGTLANVTFSGAGNTIKLEAGSHSGTISSTFNGNAVTVDAAALFTGISLGGTNNTLMLTGSAAASWTQALSGFSSITKTGTGIWTLAQTPTATTAVEVAAGTLALDVATSLNAIHVDTGATLRTDTAGALSTSSAIAIASAGTLNLNNTNQSIGALTGAGNVTLGTATLTANTTTSDSFDGTVSGTGGLTKTGTGTLTLTANQLYTGVTTISAGALQLGNGSNAGSLGGDVIDNATLIFDRNDNAVFDGSISGVGAIVQAGSGTTALAADSPFTGTTTITAGTLQLGTGGNTGSVAGPVADNGTLVFDRNDVFHFAQAISGTGNVIQAGPGTVVLDTASTYTGTTSVNAGILEVDTSLASSGVTIASGATLSGIGSIAGSVVNNGLLSPGDPATLPTSSSTSTLTIAGAYTGNNGQLAIRSVIDQGGSSGQITDRLLVAGALTGTNALVVTPLAGSVGALTGNHATDGISVAQGGTGSSSSALSLAGGYVAGGPYQFRLFAFAPGQSSSTVLDPRLAALGVTNFTDYRLQSVVVLSATDPSAPAGVPVGRGPNGEAPGTPVVVPQVPAYQSLPSGALAYGLALADELHKRSGDLAPAAEDGLAQATPELFTRAKDWHANIDAGAQPSYDQHLWFVQTGAGVVAPNVFAGGDRLHADLIVSQGGSTSQVIVNQASTHFDATSLGLAATYQSPGGAYVDGVVQGVFYDNVTVDTLARGRVGETVGRAEVASLEAGIPLATDATTTFEPRISLTFQHAGFNSMIDKDDVVTALGSSNSLVSNIGVRAAHRIDFSAGGHALTLEPFASIDYSNELLGGNHISAGGVSFAASGSGHFIRVGGGVSLRIGASTAAYLSVEHDMSVSSSSPTGNELVGTVNIRF